MPAPNLFDLTKPADADQLSIGAAQIRTDKTTLSKVLGTLAPAGTTTVGWRQQQIGNVSYLAMNAFFDGTNWQRDDTTLQSWIIGQDVAAATNPVRYWFIASGANPIGAALPAAIITMNTDGSIVVSGAGVTLPADPTTALQAATKQYVDTRVLAMPNIIQAVPKL